MRNLTKTLAVLSLLAPSGAYALGVGDIKLHSALNQKLNAEIALSLRAGENVADIRVKLAPIEKFDQAGIPWSHFLSKIKFEPVVKTNGSIVIKLTTNETITEPFLDFLLEVSSPEGNLYREFTVLVDPPAGYEQPLAPATALPSIPSKRYSAPPQRYSGTPRESISSYARTRPSSEATARGDTVQVRRNDTLSNIAKRVNSDADISDEQMAIALFEVNPQAFYRDNINALSAGRTLKVPGREAILRLNRRQAVEEFRRQNAAWHGQVIAAAKKPEAVSEEAKLTLTAPVETEVGQQAQETAPPTATEKAKPEGEPAVSAAVTAGQTQEYQLLQERLRQLELQMAEMQKTIAVKDQQLAALQSASAVKPEVTATQPEIQPQQPEIPPQPPETPEPQPETAMQPPEVSVPQQPEISEPTPEAIAQPPAPETIEPQPETAPQQPAHVPEVAPQPAVQPPALTPEPETSMASYAVFGLTGLGMLGLFAWLWMRKRRIEEEQNRESMFASSSQISLPATDDELLVPNVIEDSHGYGVSTVGAGSSFLTDFSSDFTIFDTDQNEVDPISEADVYLAYGRYQQAEELMRNAIAEQPDRDECKLKLLEIFYTNDNKRAFEDYAKELAAAGKKNEDKFWARVKEMGAEIIPNSALFADVKLPGSDFFERPARKEELPAGEAESGTQDTAASAKVEDLTSPQQKAEVLEQDQQEDGTESATTAYDFDLSSFNAAVDEEVTSQAVTKAGEEIETFDFNLDFDDFKAEDQLQAVSMDQEGDSIESLESFDFFGSTSDTATRGTTEEDAEKSIALESDERKDELFDMESFGGQLELESESYPGFAGAAEETFSDDLSEDLSEKRSFIPLEDLDDEPTENFQGLDFGAGFKLTDMDELETKIDLAKAYIDMGDTVAAKEIAEDVLARGSAEQKREAQAIIDGL